MNKLSHVLINFFKGTLIGVGALIPGLSGGTIAVTVGIFEELLDSVSKIFKSFRKSFLFLFTVTSGVLLGVLLFSPIIKTVCELYSGYVNYIFCLLSLISSILFVKKSIGFKNIKTLFLILGIIIALCLSFVFERYEISSFAHNSISLFIIGFPLALALVLPAISFSYMMLFFGIYESFLDALNNHDFGYLIPLSLGIVTATYILSILLNNLVKRYAKETYSFVLGFVCISIIDILA